MERLEEPGKGVWKAGMEEMEELGGKQAGRAAGLLGMGHRRRGWKHMVEDHVPTKRCGGQGTVLARLLVCSSGSLAVVLLLDLLVFVVHLLDPVAAPDRR